MDTAAATAALEGRYAALRGCADQLSSDELLDVIELAQREKDAASARQAVALAHLSARDAHAQEDGLPAEVHHGLGYQRLDGPELAAPRLGCSVFVATNRILDAIRQLTRTPAVVDAMASGELDEQRARTVTEETEFLSPESAAQVVDRVKDVWGQLTVGPLRQLLVRTAAQVDPDAVAAHAQDERSRRGLTRRTGSNGTDHWRGDFRVEDARGAWAAVTERARQLVREGKADNLDLARADAMMELILEHSDVTVIVHATRAADDTPAAPDTPAAAPAARETSAAAAPAAQDTPAGAPERDEEPSAHSTTHATPTASGAGAGDAQPSARGTAQATPSAGPDPEAQPPVHGTAQATPSAEPDGEAQPTAYSTAQATPSAGPNPEAQPSTRDKVHAARAAAGAHTTPADAAHASGSGSPGAEDLVEVGGLGVGGTTFVRRDWLENAGTSDPKRELTCNDETGALVRGDVPAALARGQGRARAAHRARERAKERARTHQATDRAQGPATPKPAAPTTDTPATVAPTTDTPADTEVQDVIDFSESYRVPDPMARLIRLRDGSCRFPGCTVPARQCDLDHVRPWPVGPTSPFNLMCLCRRHHRIKQRHGWTVKLHPDSTATWTDPTGLSRTTWPVDHLHLVTAGATHRDPSTHTRVPSNPADIPTTFEEELIELLGGPANAQPRAYPIAFDINGNTYGGPPPRIDLDFSPGWNRYVVDFPPRPPRPAEVIPF